MTVVSGAPEGDDSGELTGGSAFPQDDIRDGSILDALADPLVVLDVERSAAGQATDLIVAEANEAACRFIGRPLAEIVGVALSSLRTNLGSDGNLELLLSVAESGDPLVLDDFPFRRSAEPLSVVRLDVRATAWRSGVVLTWRDVTRRFESMDKLRGNEERLRLAMNRAPIGLAVLGLDGSIQEVNSEVCRLLGRDHVWLSSRSITEVLAPGEAEQFRRICQSLISGRTQSEEVQQRFVTQNGEAICLFHSVALVRDADGRPLSYVAQFSPRSSVTVQLADEDVAGQVGDMRTTVLVVSHLMGPLPALAFTTLLRVRSDLAVLPPAGRADLAERLSRARPDVLVLMVAPGQSGSEELSGLLELIDRALPEAGVVVVSPNHQRLIQRELADRFGSAAFVSVSSIRDDEALARTVQAVADGVDLDRVPSSEGFAQLTERELEVLQLMAEGLDNGGIAEAMFVTVKSVESHVSSIFRKLGLNDTTGTSKRMKAVLEYLSTQ